MMSVTRRMAWERFLALPKAQIVLPNEAAFPPEPASFSLIEPFLLSECSSRIVFIDGYFDEKLSNCVALSKNCVILPLDAAMKTYGLILQNRLSKEIREESDASALLNAAVHGKGAFLYFPPGVENEAPLQVISILSSSLLSAPRLQIFLGKGAQLDLVETHAGTGPGVSLIDVVLDSEAQLRIADEAHVQGPLFRNLRATLKKAARLSSFSYADGGVRHCNRVHLSEEEAEAELRGLALLKENCESHNHTVIEHAAPATHSRQHFKNALLDKSRSSFEGKILVHSVAQKTEAYQLNQNLLLSDEAIAHAKPNLEIFADDVKASHGATFSELSEEEIFYFRSRGFSAKEAKLMLLDGFCREALDSIEIAGLSSHLQKRYIGNATR